MPNQSKNEPSEKAFYDSFWQRQTALSTDEKCRLRFILSEVKGLTRRLTASQSSTATPDKAGRGVASRLKIADVGCGRGWLSQILSRFGEVTGFDMSISEARKRYPSGRFVECDVLHLPPGQFDIAVCSEVIEHIRPEEKPLLIESLFSILRTGGALIMTTPNKAKTAALVNELSLQQELQPVEDWLDVSALSDLVASRFEVEKVGTMMFFPVAFRKIGPLSRTYRALYEQLNGYRLLDPMLRRTKQGLYIGLVGRRKSQ